MPNLKQFKMDTYNKYLKIESKRFVISGDWHLPYVDSKLITEMVAKAKKFKCEDLMVVGDFLDQNYFADVVGYDKKKNKQHLVKSLSITSDVIDYLFSNGIKRIFISLGSHDRRIMKATGYEIDSNLLRYLTIYTTKKGMIQYRLGYLDNMEISEYNFMYINDNFHLIHPDKYAKGYLTKARQYWEIEPQCHTGVAHIHKFDKGVAYDGKHWLFTIPIIADRKRVPWANLIKSTYPTWIKGYMLWDGDYLLDFVKLG
jgi:hypothetical protein